MMNFEELDEKTQKWMLEEFNDEEKSGNPYRSSILSVEGLKQFPTLMEEAALLHNSKIL